MFTRRHRHVDGRPPPTSVLVLRAQVEVGDVLQLPGLAGVELFDVELLLPHLRLQLDHPLLAGAQRGLLAHTHITHTHKHTHTHTYHVHAYFIDQ